jgi:hypothetical protein
LEQSFFRSFDDPHLTGAKDSGEKIQIFRKTSPTAASHREGSNHANKPDKKPEKTTTQPFLIPDSSIRLSFKPTTPLPHDHCHPCHPTY